MTEKLSQLKKMTVVVADTGDIESMKKFTPVDATTNPSLIYKAAKMDIYSPLIQDAIDWGRGRVGSSVERIDNILDKLAVNFGKEILKIVPGRVSTEVDARLSFDQEGTLKRARKLIRLYKDEGIDSQRILIKIASTWEGIKAAEILEKEGIHCNLTLLFGFHQAVACAEAGVTLVSPFVGRILDWYKKAEGKEFTPVEDPGVLSVKQIYRYYKKFAYPTIVMGASFRSVGEIEELAGCDYLTIGPNFLEELQNDHRQLEQKLFPQDAGHSDQEKLTLDENQFRWHLNENPMATEKLAEGIRNFTKDLILLEDFIKEKI